MENFDYTLPKPELLAPAGDIESFNQAIDCGADAVYLGLDGFNARIKAENFNKDNIKQVIDKAHLYGVKVYITVNTLVLDEEVEAFLELVKTAYLAKADAFIVQDFGMAKLLKTVYPDIVLHASTQMGIHNADGAMVLKNLGFSRVVLSRETKLKDILDIKQKTGLEIEFFVQGALCVAFSGNCYMSSLKNGNSGNRGLCKQLCRLKYKTDGKTGYLLSPNDLCLMENLKTLVENGVTSFKIEGRLKRPAYVSATVLSYRRIIDNNYNANFDEEKESIAKVFSRGRYNTTAYLYDNFDIIDVKNQAHYGKQIGTVKHVENFKDLYKISIISNYTINPNDGLKFVGKNETSVGVGNVDVNKGLYVIYTKNSQINVNDKVYKALDFEYEKSLLSNKKQLPVDVKCKFNVGTGAEIELVYKNISAKILSDVLLEQAKSQPLDYDGVLKQLKFNDTPFILNNLTVETNGVFLPKSTLNGLRRDAVKLLIDKIISVNSPKNEKINDFIAKDFNFSKKTDTSYVILDEFNIEKDKIGDKTIIVSPKNYNNDTAISIVNKLKSINYDKTLYLNLPIVATGDEVKVLDNMLEKISRLYNNVGVVANNLYGLKYLNIYPVIGGTGLNVYNSYTAKALTDLNVKDIFANVELNINDFGLTYSGNHPLMTLCHCPYKATKNSTCNNCKGDTLLNYTDEKGNKYKIRRYKVLNCYFELVFDDNDKEFTLNNNANVLDLR